MTSEQSCQGGANGMFSFTPVMRHVMMNDPRHPVWKIIRIAVVGVLMIAFLHINYKSGLVPEKDIGTILGVLLGLIGFDVAKDKLTHPEDKNTNNEE
jgi:hypothetical protein